MTATNRRLDFLTSHLDMSHWLTSLVALATVVVGAAGQDTTPCTSYDVGSGKGICNGVNISVGAVICAGGFDPTTCKASWQNGDQTETYYFKVGRPLSFPLHGAEPVFSWVSHCSDKLAPPSRAHLQASLKGLKFRATALTPNSRPGEVSP